MFSTIRALRRMIAGRRASREQRNHSRLSQPLHSLRIESLEARRVFANTTDLPAIMGTVFLDNNGNNTVDVGEALPGVTVRLFQDDGDGVFEPGSGDNQVGADQVTLTENNATSELEAGTYCFSALTPDATYFVQQIAQTVGGNTLSARTSALLSPTLPDLVIDDFNSTQSTVAVPPPVSSDEDALSLTDESEVIGRERDLFVELLSGNSEVQLRVNPFGLEDVLLFDSSAGTQGTRSITWDGVDGDGDGLAFGLNGRDLTLSGAASGVVLRVGVDANGASSRLRFYEGTAGNFSEATIPIPVTGGTATGFAFVPFSSFSGPVSPSNVDAIQLILDTGNTSVDGQVDVVGIIGPEIQNFDNDVVVDLELAKTVDDQTVSSGQNVTWTLTLTNNAQTANSPATGVQVSDVLPAGVTLVSATPSGSGTFANGVWSLVSPLQPGASATLTIVTTINNGLAGETKIINTAQVSDVDQVDVDSAPNNDNGDQSEDDEDMAMVTVGSFIDLELTKVADVTTADTGDPVRFTLTVTNNAQTANASATGVQIGDLVPAGFTLVNSIPSGSSTYVNGIWTLVNPLAPGASQTLVLETTVNTAVTGGSKLNNVAQVIAANQQDIDSTVNNDDGDQSEDDEDMAMITVNALIDLELTKTVNTATADVGDTVTWTINVTNNQANANTAATGVRVTDVLPAGVTLVNATPSGSGTFANGTWNLVSDLAPGASASLVLTTTINSSATGGTQLINTAQVSAANQPDFDSAPNNDNGDQSEDDEDAAVVTISSAIDLELTKTTTSTTVRRGDTVNWVLTVTNNQANANASATGVTIGDVIPAGMSLVSATPSGNGTFTNGTWALVSPLAPGASATLTLNTRVGTTVNGGDRLVNTAQVTAANEPDVDSAPNNDNGDQSEDDEDAAEVTIDRSIDLEIDKTVDRTSVNVGDTLTWTVNLTNNQTNANATATGVLVQDVLPAGVTFVSSATANGNYNQGTGVWTLATGLAPGASATLTIVTTVNESASGTSLNNVAQVSAANEPDFDSAPNNDNGDQSEDDEDPAAVNVNVRRPTISKRDLLASSVTRP